MTIKKAKTEIAKRLQDRKSRRKQVKTLEKARSTAIKRYHPNHIKHNRTAIDTTYIDSIFDREYITCSCDTILKITKKMLTDIDNKEYRIDL